MPVTKSRQIAKILKLDGTVKDSLYDSDAIVASAQLGVETSAGAALYSSADTMPAVANNGDQALVTSTNRLYIYSNGGWYNIALINSTPYWSSEANSSYDLSTTGAVTTITMLAVDSEGVPITYTATPDSDFNQFATVSKDSDNGRTFTVTPTDSENGTATNATGTVTFKASDGVNLVSTLSTFSISFQLQYSNYTTLLTKADAASTDNQVDASANSNTITESGSVISTALSPYHPGGYSTYFDGSDYISFNPGADVAFGTGDFTVEAWVYHTAALGAQAILDTRGGGTANWVLYRDVSNGGRIQWYNGSTNTYSTGTNKWSAQDQWLHIVYCRSGTTGYFFLNGELLNTQTDSTNYSTSSTETTIGSRYTKDSTFFTGYMRDVRIVKGTAVYTSAFTPPTAPLTAITNTVLLACNVPYNVDVSASSHTLAPSTSGVGPGSSSTARFGPYDYLGYTKAAHGGSLDFQANSAYMAVDSGAITSSWGNNFTVEFWLHRDTIYDGTIFDNRQGAQYPGFFINAQSNGVAVYAQSWLQQGIGSGSDYLLRWAHYAFTFSGTQGKSFVNGKLTHTYTIPDTATYAYHRSQNTIGAKQYVTRGDQALGQYKARLADFRISTVLRYTTDFTPPTTALVSDSDTLLLTCTNKNDIWDIGSGTLLTKAGNVTSSNTQRKFATSSAIAFDGSGDSISFTAGYDDPLYNFGTHDWTLEGWFYIQTLSGGRNLFSLLRASANEATPHVYTQGTDLRYYVLGADRIIGSSALTVNTWHHIAATRSGNDHKLFVDGTQVGSTWTNAQTYVQGRPVLGDYHSSLGSLTGGTNLLHGYAQDFRITKGLARYTGNFTPPAAELNG